MADTTKLMLSDVELRFVKDTSWVLTKHRIIAAVYDLFHEQVAVISREMRDMLHTDLSSLASSVPKITKGENYELLPYVMLDYPAAFDKADIFALRTMFWWGNFISITLHLKGRYKNILAGRIMDGIQRYPADFFICVNEHEWVHHFSRDNYIPAKDIAGADLGGIVEPSGFIKLALKYDLENWNEMPGLLEAGYKKMTELISGQLPTR